MSRAAANVGSLAGLGQVTELRKRLLFVLFALIVYRVGTLFLFQELTQVQCLDFLTNKAVRFWECSICFQVER